jgi:ferredoxin
MRTGDGDVAPGAKGERFWQRFVRPSTVALWREGRALEGYSLFDWVHGYVYGRWPYLYISIATGEHPWSSRLARLGAIVSRLWPSNTLLGSDHSLADTYHGKVMQVEEAKRLVMVNEPITIEDLEHVIPYPVARSLILRHPDHLVALDCPCRSARAEPCLPLDVCLIVGEPFASFIADHQPERARRITPKEAVDILRAEHERGHVHHAFFKDAMLGRYYAICNCCACCCGAMQGHRNGTPMLAASGYMAQVDEAFCIGCGDCVETCQFGALHLEDGVAYVDPDECMGCGVCVVGCTADAMRMHLVRPKEHIPAARPR